MDSNIQLSVIIVMLFVVLIVGNLLVHFTLSKANKSNTVRGKNRKLF